MLGFKHMLDDLWIDLLGFQNKSVFMDYYPSKFLLDAPDNNYDYHSGAGCLQSLSHLFLTIPP